MEPTTDLALGVALGLAVVAVAAVVVLALVVRSERRRSRRLIGALEDALADLRTQGGVRAAAAPVPVPAEFLITDIGTEPDPVVVDDRVVIGATLGEPLVKAAAFAHGLRRALAPASRNRIRFEMRREVRRARKQRRQEMKEAWRRMRAAEREHAA